MQSNIIEMTKIDRSYIVGKGPFFALKNIDLAIDKQEFTGLVGPSGSGKTTLLNIIGSLDQPTAGQVKVFGYDISRYNRRKSARYRLESIGFIFQHYQLFPVYTVFENIELPLLFLKVDAKERRQAVFDALEWVGLADRKDSKPNQLSGGQCQRVAIARAIVKKPSIVLADEPTANLDSENSHIILKTMLKINEELGTTFIFSTHDEKVIAYLKRIITLRDGTIASDQFIS